MDVLYRFPALFFSFFLFSKKKSKKENFPFGLIRPEAALSFFDFGLVQIPCLMYIYIYLKRYLPYLTYGTGTGT